MLLLKVRVIVYEVDGAKVTMNSRSGNAAWLPKLNTWVVRDVLLRAAVTVIRPLPEAM
jgi:hypothetical protein